MSYWVALVARNAEKHIRDTLDSLLGQSLRPRRIIIVNDGSTDSTQSILSEYLDRKTNMLEILNLPTKRYDIRRVPNNINLAWKMAQLSRIDTKYFMISGDDCTYPLHYAEMLVARMNAEAKLVVASGRPSVGGTVSHEHSPAGSGRLIRCFFWREIGCEYPPKAGWETWLLYKAQQGGYGIALFHDATFRHARPRGAKHQFAYWGAAMYGLGYQPLYALGRIGKNTISRSIPLRGSVNMLRGYLAAEFGSSDPFISPFERSLREFVYQDQVKRIQRLLGHLVSRIVTFS